MHELRHGERGYSYGASFAISENIRRNALIRDAAERRLILVRNAADIDTSTEEVVDGDDTYYVTVSLNDPRVAARKIEEALDSLRHKAPTPVPHVGIAEFCKTHGLPLLPGERT